jgi:hypothetical protein
MRWRAYQDKNDPWLELLEGFSALFYYISDDAIWVMSNYWDVNCPTNWMLA